MKTDETIVHDEDWLNRISEILRAVAHPTRMRILCQLRRGPQCVGDIEHSVPAPQANISQHLTVLRHAGLVNYISDGALRCYYLAQPELTAGLCTVLEQDYRKVSLTKEEIQQARKGACCRGSQEKA